MFLLMTLGSLGDFMPFLALADRTWKQAL